MTSRNTMGRNTMGRSAIVRSVLPPAAPAPVETSYLDLLEPEAPPCRPLPPTLPAAGDGEAKYLERLGERVRAARDRQGMTRKTLARLSGVSERHLAQIEAGTGNVSILLLRRIAGAVNLALDTMLRDGAETEALVRPPAAPICPPEAPICPPEALAEQFRRLSPAQASRQYSEVMDAVAARLRADLGPRVALVGMSGAGRRTLGRRLAELLGVPLLVLDEEVERAARMPAGELLTLCGPAALARVEGQCLDGALRRHASAVIVMGGTAAPDPATLERLNAAATTVWVRATAAEHLRRAQAPGRVCPALPCPDVVADLDAILAARAAVYGLADVAVDSTGRSADECVAELLARLASRARGCPVRQSVAV